MITDNVSRFPQPVSEKPYDLILKGGRVIDPASGLDRIADIGVRNGQIVALGDDLDRAIPTKVLDVAGSIVTTGLIDLHGHIYENVTGDFGLNPDLIGVRSGVTALVDQGGASALTLDGFRRYTAAAAKTRIYSFISTYLAGGLAGHQFMDLYGPNGINVDITVKAIVENRDMVRGIKVHAETAGYKVWGTTPLRLAKEMSRQAKVPVYIHLGTLWPKPGADPNGVDPGAIISEIVPQLDPGDIIAHPFTKHPAGFVNASGEIHPLLHEAVARGVLIDVGRGSHFSAEIARQVLDAGIVPFTLGSDLHGLNVRAPGGGRWGQGGFHRIDPVAAGKSPFAYPFALLHAMTEMMALGMGLAEVIRMTTHNAALAIGLADEMGSLQVGRGADLSVFRLVEGRWPLLDANGVETVGDTLLYPEFAIRGGVVHRMDSPLIPSLETLQGLRPKMARAG